MIPQKIKLNNFFSHGDSTVDFVDFDSCLLIGNTEGDYDKSNGSGKSAIFESILWALFGKSRSAVSNDVIKWGEVDCFVDFVFLIDSKEYRVVRRRNRKSSLGDIEFYVKDEDGDWVDLSGSTNTETNKNIEKEIRLDYKTFINSVYFRQNDISEFAESEPSKKKEILKNIIDLSRWDGYEKKSRALLKESKSKLKALELTSIEYAEVLKEKETVENDLAQLEDDHKFLTESLDAKKVYYEDTFKKYIERKSQIDTDKFDSVTAEISKLQTTIKDLSVSIGKKEAALMKANSFLKDLDNSISEKNKMLSSIEFKEVDEKEFDELREELISLKTNGLFYQKLLSGLSASNDLGEECDHCGQTISEEHKEKIHSHNATKTREYKSKMKEIKVSLDKKKIEFNNFKLQKKINSEFKDLTKDLDLLSFKRESTSSKASELDLELSGMVSKADTAKSSLRVNTELLESLKDDSFASLKDQLNFAKKEVEQIEKSIKDKNEAIVKTKVNLSLIKEKIEMYKENLKNIKSTKDELQRYEKISKYLGKAGIQTILLNNLIQELEHKTNDILSTICNEPIQINLETQRMGSDGTTVVETLDLKIRKDGNYHDFKSLSGGEKFRISLSLRLAMSELSSSFGGTKMGFLLLDEVNSPLDRYGVETLFVSVIKSLEERYKIMVITHDESLKERFDNVLEVSKVNGESTTKFYTI